MQHIRKFLLIFSIGILFILSAKIARAQYPGMGSFRAQQSQQFINQQMSMMRTMTMGLHSYPVENRKYTFQVMLKDSSVKPIESKLYIDTALHKTYLLVVNKKFPKSDPTHRNVKIFPGETLNISRLETSNSGTDSTEITGIATDSCWRFKSLSDHISTYSYLSEEVNDNNFNPASIIAIQLEGGPIVKFNEENLIKLIGNDAKALKKIKKKDYYEAIVKYNRDVDDAQNKK